MDETRKLELIRMRTTQESFKKPYTGDFLLNHELDEPEWLIEDFLSRQNLTNLSGPPGGGKTTLALLAVASNITGSFLNLHTKPFKTLFIDEENGLKMTQYVFRRVVNGLDLTPEQKKLVGYNSLFYSMEGFRVDQKWADGLFVLLLRLEEQHMTPDLIVIDNVSRIIEGDSNTQEAAKMIHRYIKPIAIRFNCAILLISHTRKGDPKTLSDISGSGDFGAQVTIAYISKQVDVKNGYVNMWFKKVKNNLSIPTGDPMSYDIYGTPEYVKVIPRGLTKDVMTEMNNTIKDDILSYMTDDNGYTFTEIKKAMLDNGHKDSTIRYTLKNMVNKDVIKDKKSGKYHRVNN